MILFPLWQKSTLNASLVKKALPIQVMKTPSCLPLKAVLSHPSSHWASQSIWKALVYKGRLSSPFVHWDSQLPQFMHQTTILSPCIAASPHKPLHCTCAFWTLCSASLMCLCRRSQTGLCHAHPASRSGYFSSMSPNPGLTILHF